MSMLAEALSNGGLQASDYRGMTPEQIQALSQNNQQGQQLVNNLVTELAGNRIKQQMVKETNRSNRVREDQTARQLTEAERSAKAREHIALGELSERVRHNQTAEEQQANALDIEKNKLYFQQADARRKNALAGRRVKIDEDMLESRKKLAKAQEGHYTKEAEKLTNEIELGELKKKNLMLLEDQKINIGGIEYSAFTVSTTPTLSQGWINGLDAKTKEDTKTRVNNHLIELGIDPMIVYGKEVGFEVWTPASVKKDIFEKGLAGGLILGKTEAEADRVAAIIAYDHNHAVFGKKTADKYNVDTPLVKKTKRGSVGASDANQGILDALAPTLQQAVDSVK